MSVEPIRIARYAAGRDLAIQMLRQGSDLSLFGRAALEARERDDPTAPQDRWTLPYLLELQRDPLLLDGFSAVLSDFLTAGTAGNADYYRGITESMLTEPHNEPR